MRHGADIALLFGDIVDQHRLPQLRGFPGDTFSYLDPHPLRNLSRISDLEAHTQFLRAFVEQENGKDFVVDDFAHQFSHAAQSGVEIERSVDYVGDLEQQWLDGRNSSDLGFGSAHDSYDSSGAADRFGQPETRLY